MGSLTLASSSSRRENDDIVGKMKVLAVLESLPGRRQGEGPPHDGGDRDQRDPARPGPRRAAAQGAAGRVRG